VRVVFDTNIFISAFVSPGRQAAMALVRIAEGRDQLLTSKPIVDETLTVLQTKFDWEDERLAQAAELLEKIGESLATTKRIQLLKDDPDNRILECALAGRADLIVTGDRELLRLGEFQGTRIISLRAYLDMT
jgi:putative PIN family toxin of toxin-antitoxin system